MKKNHAEETERVVRLLDENTPFAVKEAYGTLRVNLSYAVTDGGHCPVYAVTSAEAAVGKSTVGANVAVSFAEAGQKTLLIDADMRSPALEKYFGLSKETQGLSELLAGQAQTVDAVLTETGRENLTLMAAGHTPPSPGALLLCGQFEKRLDELREKFDIIIIDFPPVGPVADALSLAKYVSGYVLVAFAGSTYARALSAANEKITAVGGKVLGTVLNGVPRRGIGYGKYGKYGYGYGYGK